MDLIKIFKDELEKKEDINAESVIDALTIIDNCVKFASNDDIINFGEYFIPKYDELTKEKRLEMNNGVEGLALGTYHLIASIELDTQFYNIFKKDFTKKEMYEINSFKKEIEKYLNQYNSLLINKHLILDQSSLENYILISNRPNIMDSSFIDLFVKNALIADTCDVKIVVSNKDFFEYHFERGHWTCKEGRKL